MARTATTRKRRRGRPVPPGLEGEVGEEAIRRELDAAAAQEKPPPGAAPQEPSPPPPPEPSPGGIKDLGTKSTEETAQLIQTGFAAIVGGAPATPKSEEEVLKLPAVEAQLYATCLEKVVGAEELLTPQRALWILVLGLGARVFFGRRSLASLRAAKAAAPKGESK